MTDPLEGLRAELRGPEELAHIAVHHALRVRDFAQHLGGRRIA